MERRLCVMREWKKHEQRQLHWILVGLGKRKLSKFHWSSWFSSANTKNRFHYENSVNLRARLVQKVEILNRILKIRKIKSRKEIKSHQKATFPRRNQWKLQQIRKLESPEIKRLSKRKRKLNKLNFSTLINDISLHMLFCHHFQVKDYVFRAKISFWWSF